MLDLDPDLHSEKLLDPDPQKMNADPQPCSLAHDSVVGSGSKSRFIIFVRMLNADPDPHN